MITVGMNYSVIPGKDEEFTSVFAKVLDLMNGMDGHEKTNLYRDVWSEHDYLIVSEWSDQAAFDGFVSSERFKGVVDWGKEKVLASRPTHEIYGTNNVENPATAPAAAANPTATPSSGGCPVSH